MKSVLLAAIAGLTLVTPRTSVNADDQPIPQDLQQIRWSRFEAFLWAKRTLAEPFEKFGKKDPRWDEPARKAVDLATRYLGHQIDPVVNEDEIFKAAKAAVDAGCDDPMILYLYAAMSTGVNQPDYDAQDRRNTLAAKAMESSKYPPVRRASMLATAGWLKTYATNPDYRKEAVRMFDVALSLLPESLETDGVSAESRRLWRTVLNTIIQCQTSILGDRKAAFEKVDNALAKVPAAKSIALGVRGRFFIDYAWEARGIGMASTVPEDQFRKFGERLDEARRTLQEAWNLDQTDSDAATMLVTVEMGIGHGNRDDMEGWFFRAMDTDNNNLAACLAKLLWLEPKWFGSAEEMKAFAAECRKTKNWSSGIALIPTEVHRRLAAYLPVDQRVKYYQKPEVWEEIQSLYEECLASLPDDNALKSEYAGFCYLCSHYEEAHERFQKIGDKLKGGRTFTEKWLKETRLASAERVRGETRPNIPPPQGFAILYATYGARDAWIDVADKARPNIVGDRLKFSTTHLPDPISGVAKTLVIAYSVDGKVGLAITPEIPEYSLPPAKEAGARMSDVPAQGFQVLDAHYGVADKWVDVTDIYRKRTADGKLESSSIDLPDPIFGVPKTVVILYAWEGRVFLAISPENLKFNLPAVQR
jgi:tetratricopeptide (TPR) repeat protein